METTMTIIERLSDIKHEYLREPQQVKDRRKKIIAELDRTKARDTSSARNAPDHSHDRNQRRRKDNLHRKDLPYASMEGNRDAGGSGYLRGSQRTAGHLGRAWSVSTRSATREGWADPSAVTFDAIQSAKLPKASTSLICDTMAGRLQNKNLKDELTK